MKTRYFVALSLVLLSGAYADCPLPELRKMIASDGDDADAFGATIATDNDVLIVAAANQSPVNEIGTYVYRHDGFDWVEEARLSSTSYNGALDSDDALAIDGDVIVVGASSADGDAGLDSGVAVVFRYDGSDWNEEAVLQASDGAPVDYFGWSVAVSGNTIVVGATGDDDTGSLSGSAYVFDLVDSAWVETAKLLASDGNAGDRFGHAVALQGSHILVGTSENDEIGSDAGAVYPFVYDGESWVEQEKLTALDGAAFDNFGGAISLDNGVAVIGAPGVNAIDLPINVGAAYIYEFNEGLWEYVQKLNPSDPSAFEIIFDEFSDGFGTSVDIAGDMILIGSPGNNEAGFDVGTYHDTGAAYLYTKIDASWGDERKFISEAFSHRAQLGTSVALSNSNAFAGARRDSNENGIWAGAVHEFSTEACVADVSGDCVLDIFDVTAFVSLFNFQHPFADFTSDGILDVFDVIAFVKSFNAGCS